MWKDVMVCQGLESVVMIQPVVQDQWKRFENGGRRFPNWKMSRRRQNLKGKLRLVSLLAWGFGNMSQCLCSRHLAKKVLLLWEKLEKAWS